MEDALTLDMLDACLAKARQGAIGDQIKPLMINGSLNYAIPIDQRTAKVLAIACKRGPRWRERLRCVQRGWY